MKNGICPKCNAQNVIGNIAKSQYGLGMGLYAVVKGQGLSATQTAADVRAWICAECGFTELYTVNVGAFSTAVDRVIRYNETRKRQRSVLSPIPIRVPTSQDSNGDETSVPDTV